MIHLSSFEYTLHFCVNIEISPKSFPQYVSPDPQLLGIELGEMTHPDSHMMVT